jgi:NAD(P)H-nitrite reductase large subunit
MCEALSTRCAPPGNYGVVQQEAALTRHVIVGTGVAGISAAGVLRKLDTSAEIFIVCEDPHGFYSRPGLAYYLTEEIPEKQLYIFSRKDWKNLNIRFINGTVTKLDMQNRSLGINNTHGLTYDRLLLATGSTAVPLKVAGAELPGVVKLDTLEDARRIITLARKAKSAVVVGGGIISMEMVEGLRSLGLKVHYFMRGNRYWSNVLDETESRIIEQRFSHEGIFLHYQTEIDEILQRKGKVGAVRTNNGEVISCQIVAEGVGVHPRMELAQEAGINCGRGILVNEFLETSQPGIYAAGDAAQIFQPETGESVVDTLWSPARQAGATAAMNMSGQRTPYKRKAIINVLRMSGIMVSIIGAVGGGTDADLVEVARGSSESWLQLPNTVALTSGGEVNHVRLMIGERTITGALVMGDQKLSSPLREMIGEQVDITPIRPLLLQPKSASLGDILMGYWMDKKN